MAEEYKKFLADFNRLKASFSDFADVDPDKAIDRIHTLADSAKFSFQEFKEEIIKASNSGETDFSALRKLSKCAGLEADTIRYAKETEKEATAFLGLIQDFEGQFAAVKKLYGAIETDLKERKESSKSKQQIIALRDEIKALSKKSASMQKRGANGYASGIVSGYQDKVKDFEKDFSKDIVKQRNEVMSDLRLAMMNRRKIIKPTADMKEFALSMEASLIILQKRKKTSASGFDLMKDADYKTAVKEYGEAKALMDEYDAADARCKGDPDYAKFTLEGDRKFVQAKLAEMRSRFKALSEAFKEIKGL